MVSRRRGEERPLANPSHLSLKNLCLVGPITHELALDAERDHPYLYRVIVS